MISTHALLVELRDVINMPKQERPDWFSTRTGLCCNYRCLAHDRYREDRKFTIDCGEYYTHWPMYSGDDAFPVPGDDIDGNTSNADNASTVYFENWDMIDSTTPYGQRRLALLDYLIEQTREQQ